MLKINEHIIYDVVIVGSGLGGLVSALILAKEGKKVCVLEKNNQYGGNLQTFVRNKTIFDTGVHYIGGLDPGQNLHTYFSYLGIQQDLKLKKLNQNAFDIIKFENDSNNYPLAQGYENFVNQLVNFFPAEEKVLQQYITDIKNICNQFPLYNIKAEGAYNSAIFDLSLNAYLESLTQNIKLRAVLCGNSFLYAGYTHTPFYMHALIMNSYIQSSYRCINGGSQITKLLIKQLRNYNADVYKHAEVVNFEMDDNIVKAVRLKNNIRVQGKQFISNIDPKNTLQYVGAKYFKKAYYNRIINLEDTVSSFSVFIKLKPNTIPYHNYNIYAHVSAANYLQIKGIDNDDKYAYLLVANASSEQQNYADSLCVLCYMNYDSVKKWEKTYNTVSNPTFRGDNYESFKTEMANKLLNTLQSQIPNLRQAIEEVYTSTPLSYRDYIGGNRGNLYGPVKDATQPLKHFIAPQSKIANLFFTGQGVNMHGILGVTIGAVATCAEILGKNYLINKINHHE